jgi:hypothetical protein
MQRYGPGEAGDASPMAFTLMISCNTTMNGTRFAHRPLA